ncbi:hypothetical protein GCM10020256_50190 [Streptomyces thermocoprophilus]
MSGGRGRAVSLSGAGDGGRGRRTGVGPRSLYGHPARRHRTVAVTDPAKRSNGISAFVVEKSDEGGARVTRTGRSR